MTAPASVPVAWLSEFPAGHRQALWKWLLLPLSTLMAHRNGGVWISGQLTADEAGLSFAPTRMAAIGRGPISWTLRWDEIEDVEVVPGLAIDRVRVRYRTGTVKLQSARSAEFFARVRAALPARA